MQLQSTSIVNQFAGCALRGYFKNANSLDNIKWEANFAKNKGNTFNIEKNGTVFTKIVSTPEDFKVVLKYLWKKEFTKNADNAFDAVWNNQQLKTSIFTKTNEIEAFAEFETLLNSSNSILYNFIKVE